MSKLTLPCPFCGGPSKIAPTMVSGVLIRCANTNNCAGGVTWIPEEKWNTRIIPEKVELDKAYAQFKAAPLRKLKRKKENRPSWTF